MWTAACQNYKTQADQAVFQIHHMKLSPHRLVARKIEVETRCMFIDASYGASEEIRAAIYTRTYIRLPHFAPLVLRPVLQ